MDKIYKLEREGVEEQCRQISEYSLTLVVAPMGYGKTTALKLFQKKENSREYVWISLGQSEIEDDVLWQKFCKKMRVIYGNIMKKYEESSFPKEEKEIDRLIYCISAEIKEPITIILDDYQMSNSEGVNRLITRIAYADIPNFHIVVVSRVFPNFPYEELMIKGFCKIINQRYFILSRQEMGEICQKSNILFTEEEMNKIEKYTDGWITAFVLVLLEYRQRGVLKLSVGILNIAKTAIYENLSLKMQNLLMQASLFNDFTAPSMAYVTEEDVEDVELDEIVENIGLLQYDAKTERYSMNAVLQNVALEKLNQSGMDRNRILKRAAKWNELNCNYVMAIFYYMKAQDKEEVFRLMEGEERFKTLTILVDSITKFMEGVSLEEYLEYPKMSLSYIYFLITDGSIQIRNRGKALFCQIREGLEMAYGHDPDFMGEMKIIEAFLCFNDLEKEKNCMEEAYVLRAGKASDYFRGSKLNYGVPNTMAIFHRLPGNLYKEAELEKEVLRLHMQLVTRENVGWKNAIDAEYFYMTGQIERAVEYAQLALDTARFRKFKNVMLISYFILLRSYIFQGDQISFEQCMKNLKRDMAKETRKVIIQEMDQVMGYVAVHIGKTKDIPEWLRCYQLEGCNYFVRTTRSGCIIYGKHLIQEKQWGRLESIAEQMELSFDDVRHVYAEIVAHIYRAIAVRHLIGAEEALPYLKRGLELAQPDNMIMPFVENGKELEEIIQCLLLREKNKWIKLWLPLCGEYQKNSSIFQKGEHQLLTEREMDIMTLVRGGYRNNEISKELNIAMVTVEKNLTSIYRKLRVSNRAAAIVRYREIS